MAQDQLLDLDALAAGRPQVRIEGEVYNMLVEDIGPLQLARLTRLERESYELAERAGSSEITEEQAGRLAELQRSQIALLIPDLPSGTLEALDQRQIVAIVDFFALTSEGDGASPAFQRIAKRSGSSTTGERASHRSNASTGEIPKGG